MTTNNAQPNNNCDDFEQRGPTSTPFTTGKLEAKFERNLAFERYEVIEEQCRIE